MSLQTQAIPGAELTFEGNKYLYFGGTSYLGMQSDMRFCKRVAQYIVELGTHWGASRSGTLGLEVYEKAEYLLASWLGSPSCLTLSSGFLAGRLLSEYFSSMRFPCFYSPNCHAALLPPGQKRFPDWKSLEEAARNSLLESPETPPVVFTDTVGSEVLPGPVWDLLKNLPIQCILVADDSHGLGVCGPGGSGSYQPLFQLGFREIVLCGSLGKALGITAGVIAAATDRIESMKNTPLFSGASPAPPAGLAAMADALEEGWYREKHRTLINNVRFLYSKTLSLNALHFQPNYPVITFNNPGLIQLLRENRFLFTDFEYSADGSTTPCSRLVISAAHQKRHLEELSQVLNSFSAYG